ncbi:MAG: substrate-binding domain-containing protein [Paralcaligenes sp.]
MDLCLLSGGAAFGLVSHIRKDFESRNSCCITGEFGAVGIMKDKLLAGEQCDVIILSRKLIDELVQKGKLTGQSPRDLGVVSTGTAVIAGQTRPTLTDEASLIKALLAASGIYVPHMSKSTAGIHMKTVFERLGVFDRIKERIQEFPNGATAMKAMASNAVPNSLGCTQLTEIMATPGVTVVAPLPQSCALDTVYTAAISSVSAQVDLARALIDSLCDASLDAFKRNNGFSK